MYLRINVNTLLRKHIYKSILVFQLVQEIFKTISPTNAINTILLSIITYF